MKNNDVIEAFLNRKEGKTTNVTSTGSKLFSFDTVIAQWQGDILLGNNTKYSRTTSAHLTRVKHKVRRWTTKEVPQDSTDLTKYL